MPLPRIPACLGLFGPPRDDLARFGAGHPHHDDLRTRWSRLVSDLVGRLHKSDHTRLEDLTLAIHHMLELTGQNVEDLDRAMRVLARITVRRKRQLAE